MHFEFALINLKHRGEEQGIKCSYTHLKKLSNSICISLFELFQSSAMLKVSNCSAIISVINHLTLLTQRITNVKLLKPGFRLPHTVRNE